VLSLTVVILTYNEELHIERAIRSVREIAQDIVVVDSQSTDRTVEIALRLGARVLQHPFINQAKQFGWAMTNCDLNSEWIMRLDSDEYIEPDLIENLTTQLPKLPSRVTGINLMRKQIFMGRWIRHGDRYPLLILRIWRKGKARMEDRWMDEHIFVTEGNTITLKGGFVDHNLNSLAWFVDKHNRYATREAVEIITRRFRTQSKNTVRSSAQLRWKRFVKEAIYDKLPFSMSATLYFLYRYILRLGFLDGQEGAVYHFLQGYWYRFLVGARILELESALNGIHTEAELRAELAALTGLPILEEGIGSDPPLRGTA
jgi:glycosyltransferase involved in cell wall biosynthesis